MSIEDLSYKASTPVFQGAKLDDISAALKEAGLKSRILLQVHDELVLEVPEGEKDEAATLVKAAMESAVNLEIPLEAEVCPAFFHDDG